MRSLSYKYNLLELPLKPYHAPQCDTHSYYIIYPGFFSTLSAAGA